MGQAPMTSHPAMHTHWMQLGWKAHACWEDSSGYTHTLCGRVTPALGVPLPYPPPVPFCKICARKSEGRGSIKETA